MRSKLHILFFQILALLIVHSEVVAEKHLDKHQESTAYASINLTTKEKAWLAEHPVIKVAGPKAYPPFHFYDDKGEVKGIGADYIYLILQKLGLNIEYAPPMSWPDVLDGVKENKLDLISCAAKSTEREAYLSFSLPYLSYPMVIITQKEAPFVGGFDDLHGRKIALIEKVVTYDWLKRDGLIFTPYFVDKPLDAYEAVSLGQAFAFIDNLAAASYLIQHHGLLNLKIAAPTDWGSYQLYFAVRKDWPELTSMINKVLGSLNKTELSNIRNQWISVRYEHGLSTWDVVRWIAIALIPALVLVLLFFIHNRRLSKEVMARQREVIQRKDIQEDLERTVGQLEKALADVKQLKGLFPICSTCKKIRDDNGYWNQIESYLKQHSQAEFSHSMCPDCSEKLYGDENWFIEMKNKNA